MSDPIERRLLSVVAADGARANVQLHLPAQPTAAMYWLPALGVGIGPNETLADAMAAQGIAVAIHEWRGLGGSDKRASRHSDWGYRELLDLDLVAGMQAARAALPEVPWWLGGHSLGGQFALIEAALGRMPLQGVFLVASGQPYWRMFPGAKKFGVLAFAKSIPAITALTGYFPGQRLGFAGHEAARLMREWSGTCVRGDYRIAGLDSGLQHALENYRGRVLAVRMSDDVLAPPGAIGRLQSIASNADWQIRDLGAGDFTRRRPDHFGWLREPDAVVAAFESWRADKTASR
jgi:predicted alpha/beta hydrolase